MAKTIGRCGAAELTGENCDTPLEPRAPSGEAVPLEAGDRIAVLTLDGCGSCDEVKEDLACHKDVEFVRVESNKGMALFDKVTDHPDFQGFPQAVVLTKTGKVKALPMVEDLVDERGACPR